MKPDLDKIRTLGNELKCMLETSDKFIKDSWLENYAKWMKVSYDGKQILSQNYDGKWQFCNIFFKLNNDKYFLIFPWQKKCINNLKNKTLVTKDNNKKMFADALDIWRNNSNKNMWLIFICLEVNNNDPRPDNMRFCTYDTLLNFFKTKL